MKKNNHIKESKVIKNISNKMHDLEDADDIELIYTSIYATLFGESLKAYRNIVTNYPNIQNDMKKLKLIKDIQKDNPYTTEKELVAHAYTIALMTQLSV